MSLGMARAGPATSDSSFAFVSAGGPEGAVVAQAKTKGAAAAADARTLAESEMVYTPAMYHGSGINYEAAAT